MNLLAQFQYFFNPYYGQNLLMKNVTLYTADCSQNVMLIHNSVIPQFIRNDN